MYNASLFKGISISPDVVEVVRKDDHGTRCADIVEVVPAETSNVVHGHTDDG